MFHLLLTQISWVCIWCCQRHCHLERRLRAGLMVKVTVCPMMHQDGWHKMVDEPLTVICRVSVWYGWNQFGLATQLIMQLLVDFAPWPSDDWRCMVRNCWHSFNSHSQGRGTIAQNGGWRGKATDSSILCQNPRFAPWSKKIDGLNHWYYIDVHF
jgi:hypothetical protein